MAKDRAYWIGPGSCMGAKFGEEIKGNIDPKDLKKWKDRGHISSTSLKPDEKAADSAALKKVEELKGKLSDQGKFLEESALKIAELEKVNAELKEMIK